MSHLAICRVVLVGVLAAVFLSLISKASETRRQHRRLQRRAPASVGQQLTVEPDRANFRAHRRPANNSLSDEPANEPTDWLRVDQNPLPYKNNPPKPTDDVKIDGAHRNYLLRENRLAPLSTVQANLLGTDLWPSGLDPNTDSRWYVVRKGNRPARMFFFIQHTEPVLGAKDKKCGPYAKLQDIVDKNVLTELYELRDCPEP